MPGIHYSTETQSGPLGESMESITTPLQPEGRLTLLWESVWAHPGIAHFLALSQALSLALSRALKAPSGTLQL